MFVGDKNENINFKNMACQCDDAIPGSFARAVGNLGTSLSNRAHRENFRHMPPILGPRASRLTLRCLPWDRGCMPPQTNTV